MDMQRYADLFAAGKTSPTPVTGLCGRIIRGKKPTDFLTLTDDPKRMLVMLMGPDGLEKLLGKTGYQMLVEIGYEPDYIVRKVEEGNQFKLVVFEEGGAARLATWDDVAVVVGDVYPDTTNAFARHLFTLKTTSFDKLEKACGFDMSEVDKAGEADPRYMTIERFRASAMTAVDLRAFLYFTVHLRELFSGDGYTYTEEGKRGLKEYIVANKPIVDLGDYEMIDITIQLPAKGKTIMKARTPKPYELPIPGNFDPKKTGEVFRVEYEKIAAAARAYAKQYGVKPSGSDKLRICLMLIDDQNTFCVPGFELFVGGRSGTGAVDDNVRLIEFLYRNLNLITEIAPTMDTHFAMQIFHPQFWTNDAGQNPNPHTIISYDDVLKGVWKVNPAIARSLAKGNYAGLQQHALHYTKTLTDGGKYPLYIWPYHAMLGGIGHALVASVEEAIFFHTIARAALPNFEIKGGNPLTENYSVLRPEVLTGYDGGPIGQKNTRFIEKLLGFDAVIIAGQAKSHCVAWTIDDLLVDITAVNPALASKVYLLEDCTSPVVVPGVVDFTDAADAAFKRFKDAGMHVVTSDTPIEDWKGIVLP